MQQQLMQQQQQQHTGAFNTTSVTTDHIQQYLDENKALILNILENQSTGKFSECAENQSRLQHNLMYLAAIADCQPKQSPIRLQPYTNSMQQQMQMQMQPQHMVPQPHMMAQSHTGFGQQSPFSMHHHAGMVPSGTSGTSLDGDGSGLAQPVFGDGSGGISGSTRWSIPKENISTGSSEGIVGAHPQKKGKLTRPGT
ncbi:putative transcription factor SSXT family [Helianthus annuus]|nr:putative transcription factor SSXT family [Helianthus annuus]KAJ0695614.1 putative transcription factor SSXT family [Helianthus annuus]KAJ0882348.1 putative transcription factor SSXT family [Helianthus annuus]